MGQDIGEESYCEVRGREGHSGEGAGKIWLFVQSGPRSGSTLTHELLSAFADVSVLCRFHKTGDHAEIQTVVDWSTTESKFTHLHEAWYPRLEMYSMDWPVGFLEFGEGTLATCGPEPPE